MLPALIDEHVAAVFGFVLHVSWLFPIVAYHTC